MKNVTLQCDRFLITGKGETNTSECMNGEEAMGAQLAKTHHTCPLKERRTAHHRIVSILFGAEYWLAETQPNGYHRRECRRHET